MASFGEKLRRERKARNIRVREIAESTKISSIYLRALESNDFGQLPGTVFNKGYVRAYAEFIGVDPEATVAAYEEEERAQAEEALQHPKGPVVVASPPAGAGASRARNLTLAGVAVVALGAAAVFLMMDRGDEPVSRAQMLDEAPAREEDPTQEALKASAALLDRGDPAEENLPGAHKEVPPPAPEPPAPAAEPEPVPPPAARAPSPAEEGTGARERAAEPVRKSGAVHISDAGVGSRVVDLELEDRRTRFSPGEKAHFWTRVVGGRPGDVIRHVWIREGQTVSDIEIDLGGPHWRTYSWQTMRADCGGTWIVEARGTGDAVLARETFVCSS